jgi:CDP-diacylglycerol--serine O-phosphatidyltransferase
MIRPKRPRKKPMTPLQARLAAYRAARAGRPRRRLPPETVPSFFTLMNLFSGFMALIQVYEGRFEQAGWLILLAAFFDVLDGMMARLTKSTSLFGVELDSLCDIVSFGVAPAFLVYVFGLKEFGMMGLIVASMPAICGAVRLARFNVHFEGEKKTYFSGLPIPAQALTLVALILNVNDADWFNRYSVNNLSTLIPIVVVLSGLMVSNIRFDALPKPSRHYIRTHPRTSAAFAVALLLVIFTQQIGILISLAAYLLFSIGRAFWQLAVTIWNAPTGEDRMEESDA